MIQLTHGNLLTADVEALVNTVNCVGYMGKGIALQFKKAFPANNDAYRAACVKGEVQIGRMFVHATGSALNPKVIINFPTKRHWRDKSRLEDIEAGLIALVAEVQRLGISSIAIPPLGCGLGGLDWDDVRPRIETAFAPLPQVRVLLYAPAGAPAADAMPIGTAQPRLTIARALLIKLIAQYSALDYRLSLLEIQKLAYFLQEVGQPMRLGYRKGPYGPYAHNLNKVLEVLEGHYIRGYGDNQKPDVSLELLPDAVAQADALLQDEATQARLERLSKLIEGFETPYGMELLSSVHWLAVHDEPRVNDAEAALAELQRWNPRKHKMFRLEHVRVAWQRLLANDMIPGA